LVNVEIPINTYEIEAYAFYNCKMLKTVKNLSNVTRVGECAFYGCGELGDLSELSNVAYFANDCFYDCTNVTNISFDSAVEVTEYGSDAPAIMTVKDAITMLRIGRLDNEDHKADFSQAADYEIDDYILDLASQSRDRVIDDPEEDYLENGYVYDNLN
jgi:hypothetical protein